MKAKVFISLNPTDLEDQINNFLENVTFHGLEYAISKGAQDITYSAIVVYSTKK